MRRGTNGEQDERRWDRMGRRRRDVREGGKIRTEANREKEGGGG